MTKKQVLLTIFITLIISCSLLVGSIFLSRNLTAKAENNIEQEQPEEPHEHTFGEWQVVTAATCTEEGQEQRLCECGEIETRIIAATAHSFTIISEEGNECIGITRHLQCEICGEEETISILGIGHTFDKITIGGSDAERIPATCISPAFDKETCSRCGEVQLTIVEGSSALGHEFGEWEIDVDPTYTQEGSKHRTCTRCDAEETEAILKLDVVIEVEENLLLIPEFNTSEGTINLYYTEVGSDVTASYVIGNVTSFDLTTLLTRDYMPMEAGKTYELKIMYSSGAGDYIYSNVITYESPVNYEYDGYWLYDIEGAGTWVIQMTETTFEIAEAIKVDGKYERTTDYELVALNSNVTVGTHINLYVSEDNEVLLYFDTATNLLVYGGMEASRINEEDVSVHTHTYGEYETVVQYTCTTAGEEKRTCSVCGFEQLKAVPSHHTYTDSSYDYLNNILTCSECGYTEFIAYQSSNLKYAGYTSSGELTSTSPAYYIINNCIPGTITDYKDTTKVFVPKTYLNVPIQKIKSAFSYVKNITYVYVSDGIEIAADAFKKCYDLHFLSLPASARLTNLDFTGCPSDLVVYYREASEEQISVCDGCYFFDMQPEPNKLLEDGYQIENGQLYLINGTYDEGYNLNVTSKELLNYVVGWVDDGTNLFYKGQLAWTTSISTFVYYLEDGTILFWDGNVGLVRIELNENNEICLHESMSFNSIFQR